MDLSNKNNRVVIFFITCFGGVLGIHWFVQKNPKKGIIYLFTAGGFIFGWIYDTIKTFINIFKYDPLYMEFSYIKKERISIDDNKQREQIIKEYSQNKNKDIAIQDLQMRANDFNRILTDVQCGFKNLDPYLSRYKLLLEMYHEMEEININNRLSLLTYTSEELYNTFNTELNKFIKNKILIMLDMHSIDQDDNKSLKKDLIKFRKQIIEGKHQYPEFSNLLQSLQFQLESEINKL